MAISTALQRSTCVYVFDENNRQIWVQNGELHGYTSSTVTIKRNGFLYTYDEKGSLKHTVHA